MNKQIHSGTNSFTNKKFSLHLRHVRSMFLYPVRRFENLPIKIKLPLSFLFVIVIFTSLIGYNLLLTNKIQQKHQQIRDSDLLIQQIYQFTHGVRDKYLIAENLRQTHLEIEIKRFQATQANNLLLIDNLRPHFISDRDRNMFLELERLNTHMDQVFTNELIPVIQDLDKHILINIPMSEIKNSMNQIDTLCRTIIRLVTANSENNIAAIEGEILQSKERIRSVIVVVIIASLMFSFFFTHSYVKRLRQLVTVSKEIQAGNLAFSIEMTESSDELGELSKAFMDMVQQLQNLIREIQQIFVEVQAISQEIQIRTTRSQDDAHQVVEQMLHLDHETSKQMQEMSTTSEWAILIHSHLQETLAKLFMNNRQAIEVTEISIQGNTAIQEIMEWIEQIRQLFQHTAEEIGGLTYLTEQIQSISTTVRSIAGQTNLLALNAAIEAARSGKSGAGFQIVAEEIKTLADRADISTREINGLLKDIRSQIQQLQTQMTISREKAETGMNRALATGQLFAQINRLISAVGSGLSETSHHGDEVARLNEEMEAKIQELSRVSQSISTALQSTVQTVEEQKHRLDRIFTLIPDLNKHLGDLAARVGKFTLEP